MKPYELVLDGEVIDIIIMSEQEASENNNNRRIGGNQARWIMQHERPDDRCKCGAEEKVYCVCDFFEED